MIERTAILHIGTGKTGTTSIQRTLADNRAALIEAGFAYPESPGVKSHTRLAAYMQAGAGADVGRMQRRAGPAELFEQNLRQEIAALPGTVRTVVFSCEHCYNRGTEPGVVGKLRGLLEGMFSDFRIVVYLRRQDEMAVSRLSTRLKAGRATAEPLPMDDRARASLDFAAGLEPWIASFGQAAVTPRIFAREELVEGDVVRDFLTVCGLPALPPAPAEANTSLLPAAQFFLLRLNASTDPAELGDGIAGEDDPTRAWRPPSYLRTFLTRQFGGRGVLPGRADAKAFLDSFAASNECVRATFFQDRDRLFREDFSRYPEAATDPTDSAVLAVALGAVRMQSAMIRDLQSDLAFDAAEAAAADGRGDAAVAAYLEALREEPASKRALRGLLTGAAAAEDPAAFRDRLADAPLSGKARAAIEAALSAARGPAAGPAAAATRPDREAVKRERRLARRQGRAAADGSPVAAT